MKKYFYLIVALVALVIALPAWQGGLGSMTVETLVGAFLGTVAGAMLVYTMQVRMEQTRFFQLIIAKIKDIFASKTAWEQTEDGWVRCEFRKAVGMATWEREPIDEHGAGNPERQVDLQAPEFKSIAWEGVVYRVDEKYCVASKALHDYANWYALVLNAFDSHLLNATHIKSLWRSLVDPFVHATDSEQRKGMNKWTTFFVFGKEFKNHPSYRVHEKVMKTLSNYTPAKSHSYARHCQLINL